MLIYFVIFVFTVIFVLYVRKQPKYDLTHEHCLITGGSSGIGLAIAMEAYRMGANVTIVARSQSKLDEAKSNIAAADTSQKVLTFSADVSNSTTMEHIVKEAEEEAGPITLLVNCAGTSVCHSFENTSHQDYSHMLDVNFLGSLNVTRAILPLMKERKKGRIVFVSSLAGLVGLYGYTAYSGSKFAIIGAAEALQMEVKPYNISITVSLPPDTDTPGFAEEIKDKPIETQRISESGGLFSAEEVARKTLLDTFKGKFFTSVGFEGWLLCTLCSGTTPVNSFVDLFTQVFTMGILRIIFYIYLKQCDATIKKCGIDKKKLHYSERKAEAMFSDKRS